VTLSWESPKGREVSGPMAKKKATKKAGKKKR
jgi:hypothetical protein